MPCESKVLEDLDYDGRAQHFSAVTRLASVQASPYTETTPLNFWPKPCEPPVQDEGFSEAIIDRFFRPFLGGIFFDTGLSVTSRLFQFVMRMLATGSNCLPAGGIGAVAEQLAAQLPPGSVRTGEYIAECLHERHQCTCRTN